MQPTYVIVGNARSTPFDSYKEAEAERKRLQTLFPTARVQVEYWASGGYWCRGWYDRKRGCMEAAQLK